tara:strand:- start:794 stop:1393 length:600 start_codon:yes stop_codon:yes gene_type:complete
MDIREKDNIKNNVYNVLNFIIFAVLYAFSLIYQFLFNNPTSYFISLGVDIIFSIYLIIYSQMILTKYESLIYVFISLIIFGFVVTRLTSSITFSDTFLRIEKKREEKGCKYEEISKKIKDSVHLNKIYYLYSTVVILLLLYVLLFWNDKIGDEMIGIGENKQLIVTIIIIILLTTFTVLNTVETMNIYSLNKRTVICEK